MSNLYPPVGFYFRLTFTGISGAVDTSFKEVSGISVEMDTEEIAEGGNNRFKHRVPTTAKFSNLVLKRGLVTGSSELLNWCQETIQGGLVETVTPKNIIVDLLDEEGEPLKSWNFVNAWPVKWSVSDLNSMNNEIVIESMEFVYSYFNELNNSIFGNLFDGE